MLRELNENEMEMVSGGAADEVVVTATIVRRKKPTFTNQNAFGGRTSSEQYHEDYQPGGGGFPSIEGVENVAVTKPPYDKCANSQSGVDLANNIFDGVVKAGINTNPVVLIPQLWATVFGGVLYGAASFGVHVNCDG